MSRIDPTLSTTSVLSLLVITAGTVSAAIVIMFVGLLVTMLSIDAHSLKQWHIASKRIEVVTVAHAESRLTSAHAGQAPGRYRDALLREGLSGPGQASAKGMKEVRRSPGAYLDRGLVIKADAGSSAVCSSLTIRSGVA